MTEADFAQIIALAKESGFRDFGGECGKAAIAIRNVLFPEGKLVAAVNQAFWDEAGVMIGHVAVQVGNTYYDADGKEKEWDEIEHWGMLDFEDPDWVDWALDASVTLTEETAMEVTQIYPQDDNVLKTFGGDGLDQLVEALTNARDAVLTISAQPAP